MIYVAVWNIFCVVLFSLCGLMLWRNNKVCDWRIRAIDIIDANIQRKLDAGERVDHEAEWHAYEGISYEAMLYDFRKWKFEHFFPELVK